MFRAALRHARQFTAPVMIARRSVAGVVEATTATFVVLNAEGWILTAAHLIADLRALAKEMEEHRSASTAPSLGAGARPGGDRRATSSARGGRRTMAWAAWWGWPGTQITDVRTLDSVDLAVARLTPFDPTWVTAYPRIKQPDADVEPGASLCKLGFPFNAVIPGWDEVGGAFRMPNGFGWPAFFPLEGMLTRVVRYEPRGGEDKSIPLLGLETSTPGLPGQSGGPILDVAGRVWGIQVRSKGVPLMAEPAREPRAVSALPQTLHLAEGIHPATIVGFLRAKGVPFTLSDD